MENNEMLHEHEIRITDLERNQMSFSSELDNLSREIREGNIKTEENNKFLREQNSRILDAVINRNDASDARKHELTKLATENKWKFYLLIGGGSGITAVVIDFVFKLLQK